MSKKTTVVNEYGRTPYEQKRHERIVSDFASGYYKTDIITILSILKEAHCLKGKTFMARDYGFSGSSLHALCNLDILKVVDKFQYWADIDDKTKKKVEVNVYEVAISESEVEEILNDIIDEKVNYIEEKISYLREALQKADNELAKVEMYNKLSRKP